MDKTAVRDGYNAEIAHCEFFSCKTMHFLMNEN